MTTRPLRWRPAAAWLLILALVVLRHDYWQWTRVEPLLLGWMPVALWFHVGLTLLSALGLYLITRWVWPDPPAARASERLQASDLPDGDIS